MYSESLETPLRRSNRNAIWSNLLYAFSQAISFFVIALIFWYGAKLVSNREYNTTQFFVGLIVCYLASSLNKNKTLNFFCRVPPLVPFKQETYSLSCRICLLRRVQRAILSNLWTRCQRSMPSHLKAMFSMIPRSRAISSLRISTSGIQRDQMSACCGISAWKSNLEHISLWLVLVDAGRVLCKFSPGNLY